MLNNALSKNNDRNDSGSPAISSSASSKDKIASGLSLGDTDNLAFTTEELSSVLHDLLKEKKWGSASSMIRLYPDLVTKILLRGDSGSSSRRQLTEIAKLFDKQWGVNGQDSWQSFVNTTYALQHSGFSRSRNLFLKLLENNEPAKALELRLSGSLDDKLSVIAHAEALRMEGVAHLMLKHHRESSGAFGRAKALLKTSHPYQASRITLLLGESYRHAGALNEWKSGWESAIDIQSRWLTQRGLVDPTFWKQAAFLRPASTPWPVDVIGQLESSLRDQNLLFGSGHTTDPEAVVWAIIGTQSLQRHESQNAILAFKKSEALVDSASLKEELQMQQALAMIDGGQSGPASAILLNLGSTQSLVGDRAKAILASLKLQNGGLAQGMNLLQSAIKTSNQWPTSERLRAQADYGLAFLMRGREEEGIALLNQVCAEFVKRNSYDQAAQCLANIATYYEKTDQPIQHRSALAKIEKLELR